MTVPGANASTAVGTAASTSDLDSAQHETGVRPQDDLYRHVNGAWLAEASIPPDRARYGAFLELVDGAEAAVRAIVKRSQSAEPGTEARKIGDLYSSFLDEERVERLGA